MGRLVGAAVGVRASPSPGLPQLFAMLPEWRVLPSGGLSPQSCAECSVLSRAVGVQAERGPGSGADLHRADDAPGPSQSPSMRSSSIFLLGTGGA